MVRNIHLLACKSAGTISVCLLVVPVSPVQRLHVVLNREIMYQKEACNKHNASAFERQRAGVHDHDFLMQRYSVY